MKQLVIKYGIVQNVTFFDLEQTDVKNRKFYQAKGMGGNYVKVNKEFFKIGEKLEVHIPMKNKTKYEVENIYKIAKGKIKTITEKIDDYGDETLVVDIRKDEYR